MSSYSPLCSCHFNFFLCSEWEGKYEGGRATEREKEEEWQSKEKGEMMHEKHKQWYVKLIRLAVR